MNPEELESADAAAASSPTEAPGSICVECEDNWTECGATDETTGEPLVGIGYRIYEVAGRSVLASGVLDHEGKSPRHPIPVQHTELYCLIGTSEAMDEAEGTLEEMDRARALEANARPDWRGIPGGLDEQGFNDAYDAQTRANGGRFMKPDVGLFEGAFYGYRHLWRSVWNGSDEAMRQLYFDDRALSFDEYQLATNAREASRGESFAGGAGQGLTFGFGDEMMAGLTSIFDERSYDQVVSDRRQLMAAERIANPGTFIGGEIAGAIPTIFIPVGAAANSARGAGMGSAMIAGARTGAATGAVSGAGHDEGGIVDRLDGAAYGALTGGLAGGVLSGAGILVARGVAKTRIWARITGRQNRAGLSQQTVDDILATPKGDRPDPSTYMSQADIDSHLGRFDDGAVRMVNRADLEKYGTAGPDGGFVMPRADYDRIMAEAGGDLSIVESRLDLTPGSLTNGEAVAVGIRPGNFNGLRIPSGNEGGANPQWVPGGFTGSGTPEAVMDLSTVPFEILPF
ncbi:MAG: hypothetical protein AB8B60_10580 [Sulfitobacter sp.]